MEHFIKLGNIPDENYSDYRYNVIFKAYKWDPQVEDHNTISRQVLLLDRQTANQLAVWAEALAAETVLLEETLAKNLDLVKDLGLPGKIGRALKATENYNPANHVRLMRFDFHPTTTGWAISEVNSDVPGGLAEASVWPEIANEYFTDYEPGESVAKHLLDGFQPLIKEKGRIAFIHATAYSDDRQVMEFLGDYFKNHGYETIFAAPDHMEWQDQKAVSILSGQSGEVDGIVRFFPLEWLENLPKSADWRGYYSSLTPSCNHPVAMLTQSKRLPLVWDKLGLKLPAWQELLPETRDPRKIKKGEPGWIYKPALGRVGEGISISAAITQKEAAKIQRSARCWHKNWVAQRMFTSQPLETREGEVNHLCIGVYTVNGKYAGFYSRVSPFPRIDARAKDIPVLVEKRGANSDR